MVDADGNTHLDLTSGGGHLALGYNHRADSKEWDQFIMNNYNLNMTPLVNQHDLINRVFMNSAPKGLDKVHLLEDISGSVANDWAIRGAFIKHHEKVTGKSFDYEEMIAARKNELDLDYKIISFTGAMHGHTIGTLSHSSTPLKYNLPQYENETITFPENEADESRALEDFENSLSNGNIAGVIVEPLNSWNYTSASKNFYQNIRRIAAEHEATFIIDETFTGCGASGQYWAHEAWELEKPADVVTFGRRTQASGLYTTSDFMPSFFYKLYNKGDCEPIRIMQLD